MQARIGRGEHAPLRIMNDGETMDIVALEATGTPRPTHSAVFAAPSAVYFHTGPDAIWVHRIKDDLGHPRPMLSCRSLEFCMWRD
jgi:hypothetical protein